MTQAGAPDGVKVSRDALAAEIVGGLAADLGSLSIDKLRALFARRLDAASDEEIARFLDRLAHTGSRWGYHPPEPIARGLLGELFTLLLEPDSAIRNPEALEITRRRPVVFVGNHLSYVDVHAFAHLMGLAGYSDVTENLTTLVGPKVFTEQNRRLASLCFRTIKLPQSPSRASGEAVMKAREVAHVAKKTLATVRERQRRGEHLLVFPEGSRSRSRALERCLAAVARYLEAPDAVVLPWAHTGCEQMFPIGESRAEPATVSITIGRPVPAAELFERCKGRRQRIADVLGFLIAELLPESYRGAYAASPPALSLAREIADTFQGPSSA